MRSFTILVGAMLLTGGCNKEPARAGSVTVQLPPARPYKAAAVKPGFSEPLPGAVRS